MSGPWKLFIVEVTYRIPVEQLGDLITQHRAFLQGGYDQGWLLLSGPMVPRTGGMVVARAPSKEALEAFFLDDPYHLNQVASYRFVEFDPVKRHPYMEEWVTGKQ